MKAKYLFGISYILLLLVVSWVFWGVYFKGFFFMGDDFGQMDPANVSWESFFSVTRYPCVYRPFLCFYLIALKWMFGLSPMPHYVALLFFHIGTCAGAGYVLYKIMGDWFVAVLSSILFCIFYMNYQCMFHLVFVAEPLCSFLFLVSVVCFLKFRETGSTLFYAVCVVTFILSLMTKEYALVLPVFVGILTLILPHKDIEHPPGRDYYKPYLRLLWPVLPLFVLSPLWVYTECKVTYHFFPAYTLPFASKLAALKATWRPFIWCSELSFYLHWASPLSFLGWTGTWRQPVTIGLWTVFVWKYMTPPARRAVIIFFSLFVLGLFVTLPGIASRFFYLPTIGSSAVLAITIKEFSDRVISLVLGFLRDRFSYVNNVVEGMSYRIVPVILIMPLVLFNYSAIRLYAQDYTRAHQISKSFFEVTRDTYLRTHADSFVYVNVPIAYPGHCFTFWLIGGSQQLIATIRIAIEPEDRQVVWLSEGVPQTSSAEEATVKSEDGPIKYAAYSLNLDESAKVVQWGSVEWTHLKVPHYYENIWPTKELTFERFMQFCENPAHQVLLYLPSGKLINVSGMKSEEIKAMFSKDVNEFAKR